MKKLIAVFLALSSPAYAGGVRAEIEACSVIHCEVIDITPREYDLSLMDCFQGITLNAENYMRENKPNWYLKRWTCTTEVQKAAL